MCLGLFYVQAIPRAFRFSYLGSSYLLMFSSSETKSLQIKDARTSINRQGSLYNALFFRTEFMNKNASFYALYSCDEIFLQCDSWEPILLFPHNIKQTNITRISLKPSSMCPNTTPPSFLIHPAYTHRKLNIMPITQAYSTAQCNFYKLSRFN